VAHTLFPHDAELDAPAAASDGPRLEFLLDLDALLRYDRFERGAPFETAGLP